MQPVSIHQSSVYIHVSVHRGNGTGVCIITASMCACYMLVSVILFCTFMHLYEWVLCIMYVCVNKWRSIVYLLQHKPHTGTRQVQVIKEISRGERTVLEQSFKSIGKVSTQFYNVASLHKSYLVFV